jgi:hypothetical protein
LKFLSKASPLCLVSFQVLVNYHQLAAASSTKTIYFHMDTMLYIYMCRDLFLYLCST